MMTKILIAATIAAATVSQARAQQQNSLTLACSGDWFVSVYPSHDDRPREKTPEKWGITVNFSQQTVTFESYAVPITIANDTRVSFEGPGIRAANADWGIPAQKISIRGSIDRITGSATVTFTHEANESKALSETTHEMQCGPATRLF